MAKKQSTGFGQRLRALRDAAGLTQSQLAEKAGLHVMGLAKIEHGQREPAWSTVIALARALGVGIEEFDTEGEAPAVEEPRQRGRPKKEDERPSGEKRKGK